MTFLIASLFLFRAEWPPHAPNAKEFQFGAVPVHRVEKKAFGIIPIQKTYFVTANHLSHGVTRIPGATIVARDGKKDLLLFSLNQNYTYRIPQFVLATPGTCVRTFGSEARVSTGKVTGFADEKILYDAKIAVGFSGYPVFPCENPNQVLGINTWMDGPLSGAVSSTEILSFIQSSNLK